jgi:proteasome lid subunit RPN8/RPN11
MKRRAVGNALRGVPLAACEECWPLVGERRGRVWYARKLRRTVGGPASVEFDGPAVLAREEKRRDIVGFLHTHPGFPAEPSLRDIATMQAWVSAFGKPLLCLIHGTDGLAGYLFESDDSRGERLVQVEAFARGTMVALSGDSRNATKGVPSSTRS